MSIEDEKPVSGWHEICMTQQGLVYRHGWAGVWDALKAAIMRRDVPTLAENVHFNFWVRAEAVQVCSPRMSKITHDTDTPF